MRTTGILFKIETNRVNTFYLSAEFLTIPLGTSAQSIKQVCTLLILFQTELLSELKHIEQFNMNLLLCS